MSPRPPGALRVALRWSEKVLLGLILGLYLVISRTIAFVGALYLALYFFVGTSTFKDVVQEGLANFIPGFISVAAIEWGPAPWDLRVVDGRVFGEVGEEVIRVEAAYARIDLVPTLAGLFRKATRPGQPLALHFRQVVFGRTTAHVRVDEQDRVGIVRAFFRDEDPVGPDPPTTFDIHAGAVSLLDVGGTVDAPGYHLDVTGLSAMTSFSLTGRDHMRFYIPKSHVDRAVSTLTAAARSDERLEPIVVPITDLRVEGFLWDHFVFSWQKADGVLPDGIVSASGGFDVDPTPVLWHGDGAVHLDAGARTLAAFVGDALTGALDITFRGRGDVNQADARVVARADRFTLLGLPLESLRLGVRSLPRGTPDAPEAHALAVDWLSFDGFGGRVALHDGLYGPAVPRPGARSLAAAAAPVHLTGAVRLDGVRTDALAAAADRLWPARDAAPPDAAAGAPGALCVAPPPPTPTLVGATLFGNLNFGGERSAATGATDLEVQLDDLTVLWDGATGLPLPGDYRVAGMVRWHDAPATATPGDLTRPAERRLSFERIAVDGTGDRLRLEGSVDLASGALSLVPYLRFGEVQEATRRLGLGDVRGRLVLKDARIDGTLDAPRLRATASWSNAGLGPHDLGHVTANLTLNNGIVEVHNAQAHAAIGAFVVDGRLTVFEDGYTRLSRTFPFRVDRLDATGLELGLLLPNLGLRAPVDLEHLRLAGDLTRLFDTLTGQGAITATHLDLGGEPLREVSARFDASALGLSLDDVSLVGHGGERITGSVTLTRAGHRLHGTLRAKDIPLSAVRALRRVAPDLGGTVGANLTLGGTLEHPSLIGRVALGGLTWAGLELGDADLDLQTLPSGLIDISSASFLRGFELEDGTSVALDGFAPTHLHLAVRAVGARLTDLVPATRNAGVQITTGASATLDLWPGRAGKPWDLRVDAPAGGVELSLHNQNTAWTNATPLAVTVDQDRTRLSPVAFTTATRTGSDGPTRLSSDALEVCGSLVHGGALDLQLAGVADLGFLRALKDAFSVLDGKVAIGPAPAVTAALGDARCLPGHGDAILRVTGELAAPILAGHLDPLGVTLVPRNFGREVRLVDGHGVDLAPGSGPGRQRISSAPEGGVVADIDDGSFSIAGTAELVDLGLDTAELALVGTDLFHASPGEFNATFNPTLILRVQDFGSASPRLALTGQVLVTDGHFTKSFDTFAQALGSAIGGTRSAYSRPLAESAPWLAAMTLALDVSSSDFQINSAFPLGKADMTARLDLTVSGTLGAPRIFRRIDLVPGGSLTYRVFRRDFEIRSGFADFDGDAEHPTLDIVAQTEVTYIARASSDTQDEDEKEVVIALRIHGRVPDLKIEMSSDDSSFDQDDLQSLILTGRPRRELDRSTGSSVVTADLAAVFNDVLKAPFVRTVAVGLSREGDLRADVGTCFGPDLCFSTTAVQETAETTLRARFRLHLGDDLTCDGTLRRSDTAATTSTEETYEARCRYRIPLD